MPIGLLMRRTMPPIWAIALTVWVLGSIAAYAFVLPTLGRDPAPPPAQGFSGATQQAPRLGDWSARGVYTMSRGYNGRGVGEQIERPWWIVRDCRAGSCGITLTRGRSELPPQTARLVRRADGWHAVFPPTRLICGGTQENPITWKQRDEVVLRFTRGGRVAEGRESKFSYSKGCGYGTSTADWTAENVTVQ